MDDSFLFFIVICIIIYVIYRVLKSFDDKNHSKRTHPKQQEMNIRVSVSGPSSYITERHGPPKGTPARWYEYSQKINIQGYEISQGLIYVGDVLLDSSGYENDACLINPKLQVKPAEPSFISAEMGYWPKYETIPAQCRGAYLSWLAGGRCDPKAYIGYVFLFFYGLERRLLVDRLQTEITEQEHATIIEEILRLLKIYGENHSFRGYATNLLALDWITGYPDRPFPSYIDINERFCLDPFRITLAKIVAAGNPIPADIALQWFILHPEFNLRTPARRCDKEFRHLFFSKYTKEFGEGLIVKPNKTRLNLQLYTASPSLRGLLKADLPDLPDPFILTAPLKKLSTLIEECTASLDSYSRYIGHKENDPNSLAAMLLLPKEILIQTPAGNRIKTNLEKACTSDLQLIPTASLYAALGEEMPLQISKKDAENLASLTESMGYGLAPDVRYHHIKPVPDGKIVVFPQDGVLYPSNSYSMIMVIIRLGAIVSQIDSEVAQSEEATLQSFIQDNKELVPFEKSSLQAFLYWCLRTPQNSSGLKQKLSAASATEKNVISQILISVALADGRIDPKEVKHLEKLYTSLGLDKEQVVSDLHNLSVAAEPITVGLRESEPSFAIPKPAAEAESKNFRLNEALIKIREEETRQVKGLLEDIFTDKSEEELYISPTPSASTIKIIPISALDQVHLNLFNQLISKEKWDRAALYDMCKGMGLMIDGAMEVLNEWSFTYANAPLIEDGDPVYIDVNLAREIVDGQ